MSIAAGIHIKKDYLAAALVEADRKSARLCGLALISDRDSAARQRQLCDFFAAWRLQSHRAAVSLPASSSIMRKFHVPFTRQEQIAQIIHYESEKYITSRSVEDMVVDFHMLRQYRDKSRLLVGAVPRKLISQTLTWVEQCGISPPVMELDVLALLHTARVCRICAGTGALVVEICGDSCNMLLLHNDEVLQARSWSLKADFLDSVAANVDDTVELDISQGGESMPATNFCARDRQDIYHRVAREIKRSLLDAPDHADIYICGDPRLAGDLPSFLQSQDIQASLWDIGDTLAVDKAVAAHLLPYAHVAIGLAVKAARDDRSGFNFRKGKYRYRDSFEIVKGSLALLMTLSFAALVVLSLGLYKNLMQKRSELRKLIDCAQKIYRASLPAGDEPKDFSDIKAICAHMQERLSTMRSLPDISDCLARLDELMAQLDPVRDRHYFTIESAVVSQSDALLEGRTEAVLCFDDWQTRLRRLPWLQAGDDSARLTEFLELTAPELPKLDYRYKFALRLQSEQ